MATTAPRSDSAVPDRAARRHPALIIAGTVTAALGVNLAIWLIGTAAGGKFEYVSDGKTASSTPWFVAAETAVPLALGLTLAALIAIKWRRIIPIAQVIGVLLALGTAIGPFVTDFDSTTSTVSLALMHLVVATAVVLGLAAVSKSSNSIATPNHRN
ncbi:DUF6069 family protein [Streptosporangium sp. 'caverna']|uniref:DUF6069 family protein n=1 Tax=Streptosporangium sp. 'caverna' TaxID=2202249 RepID=UPI0019550237|nr:DUF6069 family protein [Streptosporangium sp. 'caverna']